MDDVLSKPAALSLRGAYKRYGSQTVLRGLDMTVPQGSIYVLLGPSGCGKSTIFKCIVGTEQLDSGQILVSYKNKEQIGYMPQDICLYNIFTIHELALYYGMLYGMKKKDIISKLEELSEILETPNVHKQLGKHSGGQQRRVSLLISMIHNPMLLILDEPTVGLDPIIRDSIWRYFVNVSTNENKSILITTHYIEEAKQAELVGMLRGGVLLTEESPLKLLRAYQSDSLEDVFLTLSQAQFNSMEQEIKEIAAITKQTKSPLTDLNEIRLHRLKAENYKIRKWIKGNVTFSAAAVFIPLIQIIIANLTVGADLRDLHFGYTSDEVLKGLRECDTEPLCGCNLDALLSCRIIDTMKGDLLILDRFDTLEDGISAVKANKVWGLMHFPRNYSSSLWTRFKLIADTSDEDIDLSTISIWMDSTDVIINEYIRRYTLTSFIRFAKTLFKECGWAVAAAGIPVKFEKAVYGSNITRFTDFCTPAFIVLGVYYVAMLSTTALILEDKLMGLLDRSKVAGLNPKEVMISHTFNQMILVSLQLIIVLGINYIVFNHLMLGSWILLVSLMMAVGFQGICYGMLVSTISRSEFEGVIIGTGSFMPLLLLSGCVWPVEGMHYLLRPLGSISPLTQAVNAYRAIGDQHRTIEDPTVYLGFVLCIGWSVFYISASCAWNKWITRIM